MSGSRNRLVQESRGGRERWATPGSTPVWYNRSMTASRARRTGPLFPTLLAAAAIASLALGWPLVREVAHALGLHGGPVSAQAGQPLGTVSLQSIDGAPVALVHRPGRALLLNVFTTWCPSCNQEMPALQQAAAGLARDGIDVAGIDQSEDAQRVAAFASQYGLRYPIYIDPQSETRYQLPPLPIYRAPGGLRQDQDRDRELPSKP